MSPEELALMEIWDKLAPFRQELDIYLADNPTLKAVRFRGHNPNIQYSSKDDGIYVWVNLLDGTISGRTIPYNTEYLELLTAVWNEILTTVSDRVSHVLLSIPGCQLWKPGIELYPINSNEYLPVFHLPE